MVPSVCDGLPDFTPSYRAVPWIVNTLLWKQVSKPNSLRNLSPAPNPWILIKIQSNTYTWMLFCIVIRLQSTWSSYKYVPPLHTACIKYTYIYIYTYNIHHPFLDIQREQKGPQIPPQKTQIRSDPIATVLRNSQFLPLAFLWQPHRGPQRAPVARWMWLWKAWGSPWRSAEQGDSDKNSLWFVYKKCFSNKLATGCYKRGSLALSKRKNSKSGGLIPFQGIFSMISWLIVWSLVTLLPGCQCLF